MAPKGGDPWVTLLCLPLLFPFHLLKMVESGEKSILEASLSPT